MERSRLGMSLGGISCDPEGLERVDCTPRTAVTSLRLPRFLIGPRLFRSVSKVPSPSLCPRVVETNMPVTATKLENLEQAMWNRRYSPFIPHQQPTLHRPPLSRFAGGALLTLARYTPQKNKQRLQMKKVRRKRMNPPGTKKQKEKRGKGPPLGDSG